MYLTFQLKLLLLILSIQYILAQQQAIDLCVPQFQSKVGEYLKCEVFKDSSPPGVTVKQCMEADTLMNCLKNMQQNMYVITVLDKNSISRDLLNKMNLMGLYVMNGDDVSLIVSFDWINRHQNRKEQKLVMRRLLGLSEQVNYSWKKELEEELLKLHSHIQGELFNRLQQQEIEKTDSIYY